MVRKKKTRGDARDDEETEFLNVDVDVRSRCRLEPLVAAFGQRVWVNYVGRWGKGHLASFSRPSYGQDADTLARELATLVTKLPRAARRLWDRARSKTFDIGIQAGFEPRSHQIFLKPDTVKRIAGAGGRIVVTTYAPARRRASRR